EILEAGAVACYFPRGGRSDLPDFDVEKEIEACGRLSARAREEADDALAEARFREAAVTRLKEEGRDPTDASALKLAVARERKNWVRERLSQMGQERGLGWGWPNIYTYTKSMGEQLVANAVEVTSAIVRPSIVESAVSYPFPGWNEGFNTSAPMIHAGLRGQNVYPGSFEHRIDFIPVDYVASGVVAVTAQLAVETPAKV